MTEKSALRANQYWICDDCDIGVPVYTSDPVYPDEVYCPECSEPMDVEVSPDA